MSVRQTIAATLIGLLMVEAAGLAQVSAPGPGEAEAVVVIPRAEAIRLLLANIAPGSYVRIELADGSRVDGTIGDLEAETVIVAEGRLRRAVAVSDIAGVRLPSPIGMPRAKAFGIGAAAGGALFMLLVAVSRSR